MHDKTFYYLNYGVMSILLYEVDNLNIVAGKWTQIGGIAESLEEALDKKPTNHLIRIHISIQVNWKIKTIFQQYEVDEEEKKLKEYHALNALSDILSDLWYRITWLYWIIEKWIDKLYS